MSTWVIVGAGYTGGALARRLASEGHDVIATRRTPPAAEEALGAQGTPEQGYRVLALDLARPPAQRFPGAIVVCCAPPGADPAGEMANLVALGGSRIVYVSSTGVYAPGGGAWVDESWPIAPIT